MAAGWWAPAFLLNAVLLGLVLVDNRDLHALLGGVSHMYRLLDFSTVWLRAASVSPLQVHIFNPGGRDAFFGAVPHQKRLVLAGGKTVHLGHRRVPISHKRPGQCLPYLHGQPGEYRGASELLYGDWPLYRDLEGTNYPMDVCEAVLDAPGAFASRAMGNVLGCDNWVEFSCFATPSQVLVACVADAPECPTQQQPQHADCCEHIFAQGGFFHVTDPTQEYRWLWKDSRFVWSLDTTQTNDNTFRLYDGNRVQLYATPLVVRDNELAVGALQEEGHFSVQVRHTTASSAKTCGIDQLFIEKDSRTYSLNMDLPNRNGFPIDIVQIPRQMGGAGFELVCNNELPFVPEAGPTLRQHCIIMDPVVTRLSLTVSQAFSCAPFAFVPSKGLLWRVQGGFVVCWRNRRLQLFRGQRCPMPGGDLYLYRKKTPAVNRPEGGDRMQADVGGWVILHSPVLGGTAQHYGLYWDTTTDDFSLRAGLYVHTFHVECVRDADCWETTGKPMGLALLSDDFDWDTAGTVDAVPDETDADLAEFYVPRIDWILRETLPRTFQLTRGRTMSLPQESDNTMTTFFFEDEHVRVDKLRLFATSTDYDTEIPRTFPGLAAPGDAGRLGLLYPTPVMYPFLQRALGVCQHNLDVELGQPEDGEKYFVLTGGTKIVCPPSGNQLCYRANMRTATVVLRPEDFVPNCNANADETEMAEIPAHHVEAFLAMKDREVLASASISDPLNPYINLELEPGTVDEQTGCSVYELTDQEYPVALKRLFTGWSVTLVDMETGQDKTAAVEQQYGAYRFVFDDPDGGPMTAFPVNRANQCLANLDQFFGDKGLSLRIVQAHQMARSTFNTFTIPQNAGMGLQVKAHLRLHEVTPSGAAELRLQFRVVASVHLIGGVSFFDASEESGDLCRQWESFYKKTNKTYDYPRNTRLETAAPFYTRGCGPACSKMPCLSKSIVQVDYVHKYRWWLS